MLVRRALGIVATLGVLMAVPALAEEAEATQEESGAASLKGAASDAEPSDERAPDGAASDEKASDAADHEKLKLRWSLTARGQYDWVDHNHDDHDDVTGYFDQYEFVPNKSSGFPFQLGVSDASLDLLGAGDTPLLQFRLESPTSNLGVSGSQIDEPFFNQRALLLGRTRGLDLDLTYRRMRTEDTRVFPNTDGAGLLFEDRSGSNQRFEAERTGFAGELRARVGELFQPAARLGEIAAPELSLRGGYESRQGNRQLRFLVDPTNTWVGLAQGRDQQIADVGGGLIVAPARLFTLAFDFDHQRFRENEPTILQSSLGLGILPTNNTVDFVPDTDRYTGTARLRGRIGERTVLEGGFQLSMLEQTDDFTPFARTAALRDNRLYYYSANFTADVALFDRVGANAYFKFDQRDNEIDRNTSLFRVDNGSQVDEFMRRWRHLLGGIEAVYRIDSGNRAALGGRFESIHRDRDFSRPACPAPCFPAILPVNALVQDDTESYTVYARSQLRVMRRIGVNGELGYRLSPDQGYVTDLDHYIYGKLRASYTLPVERTAALSLFAQGGSGDNRNQVMVSGGGIGTPPTGPDLRRHFDRLDWLVGVTANASPWDPVGLFASFFVSQDAHDYELALSSLQRYVQPFGPVTFRNAGSTDYENQLWSVVLGGHYQIDDKTDASLSGSFTRAYTHYSAGSSPQLALVSQNAKINSNIYGVGVELGHWLRKGLRVLATYRFEYYDDGTDQPESLSSAVVPFDLTSTRHTVTLGVTLTSALLD
jgi:hypothetical protein